jgi:hypothetical protein
VAGGVESKVSDREDGRPLRRCPPQQRAQAREQLVESERLREIVVGSRIETFDAILDSVAGGQHQHRAPDTLVAKPAAHSEAVRAGKHDVEEDRIVSSRLRHPDRILASAGDVGRVALLSEPPRQHAGELRLVLDDQHPHGSHSAFARVKPG